MKPPRTNLETDGEKHYFITSQIEIPLRSVPLYPRYFFFNEKLNQFRVVQTMTVTNFYDGTQWCGTWS